MALKGLANIVKEAAKKDKSPSQSLLDDLNSVIILENKPRKPKANYKPSMIGSCLRQMYFCKQGEDIDDVNTSATLMGICESGSARHDHLQNYMILLNKHSKDWEWVDVSEFIKRRKPPGTIFEKKMGNEYKLRNDILGLSFMCDGVIYNKRLKKHFILEIKTEASIKYRGQTDIWTKHKIQAACYSAALGIEDVIFIYENRDFCDKIAYDIKITDSMKAELVLDKIEDCNNYIEEGLVPPKTTDVRDCKYCSYKGSCKKWGIT